MKSRRANRGGIWITVIATSAAIGLMTGLGFGAKPPLVHESPSKVSDNRPIEVSTQVVPDLNDRWVLIADEDLARRRPPSDVSSCSAFFSWAQSHGATSTGTILHAVSIRAHRRVRVDVDKVYARQMTYSADRNRQLEQAWDNAVRLTCNTRANGAPPSQRRQLDRDDLSLVAAGAAVPPESYDGNYMFDLAPGAEAVLTFAIDERFPGDLEYLYSLVVQIKVDGVQQTYTLDNSGRGFKWGTTLVDQYPPTVAWTMQPAPTLEYCDAVHFEPTPPRQLTCRPIQPN